MKNDNILDDFTEPTPPPSRKGVDTAIWIYAIIIASLFLFYELILKNIFPVEIINPIRTKGFFILICTIIICNLLVRKLNQLAPDFNEKIFAIWGASSFFYGSVIFRIIYEMGIHKNFNLGTVWFILKMSMILSLMSGAISYVVINRVRKNDMNTPYFVLIGVWIGTGILIKMLEKIFNTSIF